MNRFSDVTSSSANDFLVRITRGGSVSIDLALSALAERGDVRILSRPLILAENNLEARILVGSQRPFVQVFGGRGYMRENAAERFFRELRVDRIWEGTSEIQRLIIARAMEKRGVDRVVG